MKQILVIVLVLLASCSKQAKPENGFATKKSKGHQTELATTSTVTLTNNGGGSFSIDYGGATDVVWVFFRGGDTLSSSGNVIPQNSMSFYLNPVTTFQSTFTRTYYQAVVATGSTAPDANGVVGADWVFSYSNVVQ